MVAKLARGQAWVGTSAVLALFDVIRVLPVQTALNGLVCLLIEIGLSSLLKLGLGSIYSVPKVDLSGLGLPPSRPLLREEQTQHPKTGAVPWQVASDNALAN